MALEFESDAIEPVVLRPKTPPAGGLEFETDVETAPEEPKKKPREFGVLDYSTPASAAAGITTRYGAMAGGTMASTAIGLRNLLRITATPTGQINLAPEALIPGAFKPVKFHPRTLVKKLEDELILAEANGFDRMLEDAATTSGIMAVAGLGGVPLAAAGVPLWVANAAPFIAATLVDLEQQEVNYGISIPRSEKAKAARDAAIIIPLGHFGGKLATTVAEGIMGRELGRFTKTAITNASLGVGFGTAAKLEDPDNTKWFEAIASNTIGMTVGGAWMGWFQEPGRARIPSEIKKQMEMVGDALENGKVGQRRVDIPGVEAPLFSVGRDMARSAALNDHLNSPIDEIFRKWNFTKKPEAIKAEGKAERARMLEELKKSVGEEEAAKIVEQYRISKKRPKGREKKYEKSQERAVLIERLRAQAEAKISEQKLPPESVPARVERLRSFGVDEAEIDAMVKGRRREALPPEAREVEAERLAARWGVPIEETRKMVDRRLTDAEAKEAILETVENAILLEAEARGPKVAQEAAYRLGLMEGEGKKLYEARRAELSPEERDLIASRVPSAEEARAKEVMVQDEIRAMEAELAQGEQPTRFASREAALEQVKAETEPAPQGTAAQELQRRLVERGVMAEPEARPEMRAVRPSKKAAGQAETQARIERGEKQKFKAEQQRMMEASKKRILAERGARLEEEALRQARERAASPEVRPAPPPRTPEGAFQDAIPRVERDLGGKAARVEAPKAPRPVKAPGSTISNPSEMTVGEAIDRAGAPLPEPKAASVVERAKEILGERATQTPQAPEVTSKKGRKELRAIEDALDAAERDLAKERGIRNRLKPYLPSKKAQQRFLQVAPWVVGAGSLAAQAFGDDDDKWTEVATWTGTPAFAWIGRGKPMAGHEEWARNQLKRDGAMAEMTSLMEQVIYRPGGRLSHAKLQNIEARLAEILGRLEEIPGKPGARTTWEKLARLRQYDELIETVGEVLSTMGPGGKLLSRLAQDMMRTLQMEKGEWKFRQRNIDTLGIDAAPMRVTGMKKGFRSRTDTELSKGQQKLMDQYIESIFMPEEIYRKIYGEGRDAFDINQLDRRSQLRSAQVLNEQMGWNLGDAKTQQAVENLVSAYDDFYSSIKYRAMDELPGFMPLENQLGRYRQAPWKEEVFYPDPILQTKDPAEFRRRYDIADAYHEAITQDLKAQGHEISKVEVGNYLRNAERAQKLGLYKRSIIDISTQRSLNLDYHRVLPTRIGRVWDPVKGFNQYMEGALLRLNFTERFGPNGERARKIIAAMKSSGGWDEQQVTKFFDAATMQSTVIFGSSGELAGKILREPIALSSLTKLGSFVISQFPQAATTFIQGELPVTKQQAEMRWRALAEAIGASIEQSRTLPDSIKKKRAESYASQFLAISGVVTENIHADMFLRMGGMFPRALSTVIRYGGGQVDRLWRNMAGVYGDLYFQKIHEEYVWAKRRGMTEEAKNIELKFDELFDEPLHRQWAKQGDAIDPNAKEYLRYVAASTVSNRTQYRTLPIDLPLAASDPLGRSIYPLLTFNIRAGAEFNKALMRAWHNPARRWHILGGMAIATGSGAAWLQVQRARRHDAFDPDEDSILAELLDSAGYGAIATPWIDGLKIVLSEYGNPIPQLGGSFWSTVYEGGEAWSNFAKSGNPDPALRWAIKNTIPSTPLSLVPGFPTPKEISEKLIPKRGTGLGLGGASSQALTVGGGKKKSKLKRFEESIGLADLLQ